MESTSKNSIEQEAEKSIKHLEAQGIFALNPKSFTEVDYAAMAVRVEVALLKDAKVAPLNWNLEIVNKRECGMTVSDFSVTETDENKLLSFIVHMRLPDNTLDLLTKVPAQYATTFADLCWFHGHEAISHKHAPETYTKVNPTYEYNDLGWYLPSRFTDRLIDTLGKLNDWILSGVLEDAIIYGVHLNAPKN